jgi:uncharacterized membrane protein YedE/YeeE
MYEVLQEHPFFENLTAPQASVYLALAIGLLFGALAEQTKFCFRRGLVGDDRRAALGVWMMALASAIVGTQAAIALELVDFSGHRFFAEDLPIVGLVLGGLMFGAGMVLTRGCVSRLTVLSASGNLRALTVLAVFAIIAHATLKGVLAPLATQAAAITLPVGDLAALASLPGGTLLWAGALLVAALAIALRSGNPVSRLVLAALLGLLVPAGWVGTGFVLYDDFDPVVLQSLSFTAPWADTLFWTVASTSIPAGFGVGLIGGVLLGSLISALLSRRFAWQSFTSPRETGRYLTGAGLMGIGAVLAGGCTVGAGLAGIPALSLPALIVLGAITLGALGMNTALKGASSRAALSPAE